MPTLDDCLTLDDFERAAPTLLTAPAWHYYAGGAMDERTLRDNCAAFARVRFRPRVLVDVSRRDLSVTVAGTPLATPLIVAPMAFHGLACSDGECATAIAAEAAGAAFALSTMSNRTIEEVAAAAPTGARWFQLYVHTDRGFTEALVDRAEAAGYTAIILTVDAPQLGRRLADIRHRFGLPVGLELANLRALGASNLPDALADSHLAAHFSTLLDTSLTWRDLEWLCARTRLPVLVKGILRHDDAARAAQHGARGVIVSNHGGRQLDGAMASLDALPAIEEAVGDRVDVILDGGIRRGTDVLAALALGARAVMVGRPILYGLAVAGQAGARRVLQLLRDELDLAMALAGCPAIADVTRDLIA